MTSRPGVRRATTLGFAPIVIVTLAMGLTSRALAQVSEVAPGADAVAGRTAQRLRTLHEEADRLASQERGLLTQLRELEVARQIANEERQQAGAIADAAAVELQNLDLQTRELEAERDAERPKLQSRLTEMYKLGRGRYVRLLLSASDVRQLGQASRTVAALAARDQARFVAYGRRLVALSAARQTVANRQIDVNEKRADAERAQVAAGRAVAAQVALVREIDQRRDLNAQLASELVAAQRRLESTLTGMSRAAPITSRPIGPFRRALPWPVTGPVVRRPPGDAPGARAGIDIEASEGSPVQAVLEGTVAFAGSFDGLGNLVIVDHGGQTFTLYGHLLELAVGKGATVAAGQTLGRVGTSPNGVAALYFELRVNGSAVNPVAWLERSR